MMEDKRSNIRRALLIVILVLSFSIIGMLVIAFQSKTVIINYLGSEKIVKTLASNVGQLISQKNIYLDDTYTLSHNKEEQLQNKMKIDILKDQELAKFDLGNEFKIDAPVTEKIEEIEEAISFETETKNNASVNRGQQTVVQKGEEGQKVISYKITYKDGIEVARKLLSEQVIKDPTTQVVEVGTKITTGQVSSRYLDEINRYRSLGAKPTDYSKTIDVKYTVYCLCKKCTGKTPDMPNYGNTASGLKIIPNAGMKVIAVDTRVIPLGSWVYVESTTPGIPDYGYAYAGDTGSAIKGNKIDLYIDEHTVTGTYKGRGTMKVYILN